MQGDKNDRCKLRIPLRCRLLLVLIVWSLTLLIALAGRGGGLLIAALGEERRLPTWWSQDVVCVLYVVLTWTLLRCSRPIGFFVIYGVLLAVLLLNAFLFADVIGAAQERFFP